MARTYPNNPLWVLCCCGGLPIIALLKGVISCLPIAVFITLSNTAISLFYLPHDIYYTYYTVLKAKHLGPNITVLAILLLPIPLICWPILVTLTSVLGGVLFGLFYPAIVTFEEQYNMFYGGLFETFDMSWDAIKKFHEFNSNSYFLYLSEYRESKQPVWDIAFFSMVLSLILGLSGALIDGVLGTLALIIYALPCYARCYYEYIRWFRESAGDLKKSYEKAVLFMMVLPFWILGFILLTPALVLVLAITIVGMFLVGLSAAYTCYTQGVKQAIRSIFYITYTGEQNLLNFLSNSFPIFDLGPSPCFFTRPFKPMVDEFEIQKAAFEKYAVFTDAPVDYAIAPVEGETLAAAPATANSKGKKNNKKRN